MSGAYHKVNELLDLVIQHARGIELARLGFNPSLLDIWADTVEDDLEHLSRFGAVWNSEHERYIDSELEAEGPLEAHDRADALAYAADLCFWTEYAEAFALQSWHGLYLTSGTRYPLYDRLFDVDRSSDDWSSERWRTSSLPAGETPHIAVWSAASEFEEFEVVVHGRYSDRLAPFGEGSWPVATAHPHADIEELEIPSSRSVFGVAPKDPAGTRRWSESASQVAVNCGARVIVFPELSQGEAEIDELIGGLPKPILPTFICLGSYHQTRPDGQRVNESTAVVTGRMPLRLSHTKFNPFDNLPRMGRMGLLKRTLLEGITVQKPHRLNVYEAGVGRVAIMICKDLLHPASVRLVDRLGLSLLLVPSMSPRVDQFVDTARYLASRSQVFSIVSNGPTDWGRRVERNQSADSIVARPVFGENRITETHVGSRSVCIADEFGRVQLKEEAEFAEST